MARNSVSRSGGKKRDKNAAAGVVENKVISPVVKFVDLRAAAGQRMSIVSARMGEKLIHFRANLALGFYRIRHPIHPVRRFAAAEATKEMKAAASGNRKLH